MRPEQMVKKAVDLNKKSTKRYRRINLDNGKQAFLDIEDFERLKQYKWRCGKAGNNFYALSRVNNKNVSMHGLIMGAKEGYIIDHINGNGLNNKRKNLRFTTKTINALNSSIFAGYSFSKILNKYACRIRCLGTVFCFGNYEKECDAIKVANISRKKFIRVLQQYGEKIAQTERISK